MSREKLKSWAKMALGRNYWKSVLVALILSVTTGASTSSSSSGGSSSDSSYSSMSEEEIIALFIIMAIIFIIAAIAMAIGMAVKAFLLNPLHIGCQSYFCDGLENPDVSLGLIGKGFRCNYKNVSKIMFFRDLYLFLWSMIAWIPGVLMITGILVVAGISEAFYWNEVSVSIFMIGIILLSLAGVALAMIPWIIKSYEYMMVPYILVDNPDMNRKEVFALSKEMMTGHKWEAFVLNLSFLGWHLLGFLTCFALTIFYVQPYQAYTLAAYYKVLSQKYNAPLMPDYTYSQY